MKTLLTSRGQRLDIWLTLEWAGLARDHPQVTRLLGWVDQRVVMVFTVLGAVMGGVVQQLSPSADGAAFLAQSGKLFSSEALNVFDDPFYQVGPVYLVLVAASRLCSEALSFSGLLTAGALESAVCIWLLLHATGKLARVDGRNPRAAQRIVGGTAVLMGPLASLSLHGHLDEFLVTSLLVYAVSRVAMERFVSAGLVVGLAAGTKLWGILAIALLLAGRRRVLAVACASTTLALLYLPFQIGGQIRTFEYVWSLAAGAPLSLVWPVGEAFPWSIRLVQGTLAVAIAWAISARRDDPLLALAAILVVKLLLDPNPFSYYGVALLLVGLVWATRTTVAAQGVAAVVGYVALGSLLPDVLRLFPSVYAWLETGFLAVTLLWLVAQARRTRVPERSSRGIAVPGPVG